MRYLSAIFCAIAATAAAVTNPLGSDPANYTFTIPACTNLLQGRLSGPGGDYRAMRMEDMDYLAEAAAERVALKSSVIRDVTNRVAVIHPGLSLYPGIGGGANLKAIDDVIKGIGGSSGPTRTAYTDKIPVYPKPVVSASPLTRDEILSAATSPAHVISNTVLTRCHYPALADLTNRYVLLDAIPCIVSRDGGKLYSSNSIGNLYHYEVITNGTQELVYDGMIGVLPSGRDNISTSWQWTRESKDLPWVLTSKLTTETFEAATNFTLSAFDVPGSFSGLAFAITSAPARVENPRAIVEWRVFRSDVTQNSRTYINFTYSNVVESASYETNYVYTVATASASAWHPVYFGMVADVTETDATNVLAACRWRYPHLTDAHIPANQNYPIPPGGMDDEVRYDEFVRWREINLTINPQVRFYLYETKFKTTIGGN